MLFASTFVSFKVQECGMGEFCLPRDRLPSLLSRLADTALFRPLYLRKTDEGLL